MKEVQGFKQLELLDFERIYGTPNHKVFIKTIWGCGMVSVSGDHVYLALKSFAGLEIIVGEDSMIVEYHTLLAKKPRSTNFKDKYGRSKYYVLYDFFWRPDLVI